MAINVGSVAVSVVPSAEGFREKLDALLADLTATVRLRLDDEAARLGIDELQARLDTIRDRTINVRVDSHGGASEIAGLNSAASAASSGAVGKIALIGAAIVALIPIAAAASIAIAGIGAGIGAGIAALGVGALALSGVGGALTAKKTAGSGGGGGGGQSAGQAAEAAAQNANSQRQAEIQLTVAQRDAAQAQRDLTQARIDAAQNLQNLTNDVADNALAQRKATLDLQAAKLALTTANNNPDSALPGNQAALAGLQLGYDQAKQSLTELQEKGTQLATQKAAADAAGVDGATTVVAAQNKVVDSQNAVTQAQFQVADSARQAALGQAAAAGGASAYQTALAKLNPAQQKFVEFLQSIKGQFDVLKDAASTSFLPLLQQAITNLLPVLPQIASIIGEVGKAFGDIAVKASAFFTSPDGQKFLAFIQTNLAPAIETLAGILGGLFTIASDAFQQAYPLIKAFGDAVSNALSGGGKAVQGGALNGFFAYVKEEAPKVERFLGALADAIGHIVDALAPLAGPLLDGLSKALDLFSKIPVGDLQIAAGALGRIALGLKGLEGAAPIVANPELAAVAALAVGLVLLYQHSKTFRDFVNKDLLPTLKEFGDYIRDTVYPVVKRIAEDAFDGLKKAIGTVGDAIQRNKPQLTELVNAFKDVVDFVVTKVLPVLGPLLRGYLEYTGQLIGTLIDVIGFLVKAFNGIADAIKSVAGFLKDTWNTIYNDAKTVVDKVVGFVKGLPDAISNLAGDMVAAGEKLINGLFDGIQNAAKKAGSFAADIATDIKNAINSVLHLPLNIPGFDTHVPGVGKIGGFTLIPALAAGGPVVGPGTGTSDSILAALSNGEFVMTANAASTWRPELEAMNAGGTPTIGSGKTVNITVNDASDPVQAAYAVQRRLQFAGA